MYGVKDAQMTMVCTTSAMWQWRTCCQQVGSSHGSVLLTLPLLTMVPSCQKYLLAPVGLSSPIQYVERSSPLAVNVDSTSSCSSAELYETYGSIEMVS